jgi:hypothetical protein
LSALLGAALFIGGHHLYLFSLPSLMRNSSACFPHAGMPSREQLWRLSGQAKSAQQIDVWLTLCLMCSTYFLFDAVLDLFVG